MPAGAAPTDVAISPGAGVVLNRCMFGNITIMVNGETFTDVHGFSEFRVGSYDSANNFASGDFRAALRNDAIEEDLA